MQTPIDIKNGSPFHAGEQEMQTRAGKRDAMEIFGRKVIRPFMPDQHRAFFNELPFIVLGSVDADGWPWASVVAGHPGFIQSPHPKRLEITNSPVTGDPLSGALAAGAPIGVLGIEIASRRRNRMNARVIATGDAGFGLSVDQSFGNCPQYIQTRAIEFIRDPQDHASVTRDEFQTIDATTRGFIEAADTFFVSSFVQAQDRPDIEGVDVSHRGGRAGFVKIAGNTLTIPDYSGNYHFNTLGNFLLNPKAGLIFPDFETGDVVMMTGAVELIGENDPEIAAFEGAERGWRFTLDHGMRLSNALPFRATFGEWSPNSLMAGDWAQTAARIEAEASRNAWRPHRITRVEDESSVIRSFYFEPADGTPVQSFKAGQFLTIRVTPEAASKPLIRTYTVSSAPGEAGYRISVKREQDGAVSDHLHANLKVGDVIDAKAPKGAFHIDVSETRPAVLLAGGVGITPMISMARHAMREGLRTRHIRPLTVFHGAQTMAQRAFATEFRMLERQSGGAITYHSVVSRPSDADRADGDFDHEGYVTSDVLQQVLPLADYDFFLCGPAPFMQSSYDMLRELGVSDARILAEAFGPAGLKRTKEIVADTGVEEADEAVVKFTASGFDQRWSKGDETLLETAEAHGLTPDFSCRSGSCGSCAVRKLKGDVAYRTPPTAEHGADEVLICCAVPAKGTDVLELDL